MSDPSKPAGSSISGENRLDPGDLPTLLGFHLRLAQVAMRRDFAEALADLDLTQKQYGALEIIAANPGLSQMDLGSNLANDRATIMALVARLEARGLVVRRRSAADRRRQELGLTPEGRAVLARAKQAVDAHERRITSRFTAAELKAMMEGLARIHGRLT
ncbi:MarR family winged helix-turn-helix transcriptional regulator [Phenylobacterium sp. LjRoot225]|uniref:MarR family winged helix-turn-helix transcriptional regulator n=1 Tax=Phenylobacterium sp. LjRoot225 TaxID=3342285 RepID=UPI003ED0C19B